MDINKVRNLHSHSLSECYATYFIYVMLIGKADVGT